MNYTLNLLKATLNKDLKYLIRYKFNTIFSILMFSFMFIAASKGYKTYGKDVNSESIENLLGGYLVWLLMVTNLSSIVNNLVNETNLGTLEQLYISSKSFHLTIIIKGLSSLLISIFQFTVICLLITLFNSSIPISFILNFIKGLPILLFGIPAIWGLSLIVSSFALYYKNISSFFSAITSTLFAVVSFGVHKSPDLALLFPFGLANMSLQNLYTTGSYPNMSDIIFITLNSGFYIITGIIIFNYYEKRSKIKGMFAKH